METAKDILRKYDVIMIGENPKSEAAIKEIADKAWDTAYEQAIQQYKWEQGWDDKRGVDKETFMKSLFPETKM